MTAATIYGAQSAEHYRRHDDALATHQP